MSGSSHNINPLHAVVFPDNHSGFTALNLAIPPPCVGQLGVFRLPQPVYTTPSKSAATSHPRNTLSAPITFDVKGSGAYGSGFSMRDLCARGCPALSAVMRGGEDEVLHNNPGEKITFRIMWLGYAPSVSNINIACEQPITRVRIGQIIAQKFARFIEAHRKATSSHPMFGIAEAGIRLDRLFLLSLYNTCDESWQADVVVNMRIN